MTAATDRSAHELGVARAGRRDLLVLDNFEQVLAGGARRRVAPEGLPDATVLVTSRARLRVRGEHVFDVVPPALPERSGGGFGRRR